MAHFYGTVQGNRSEATRMGHKKEGLTTAAASWSGAVRCHVFYRHDLDEDWVEVRLGEWRGAGEQPSVLLYRGPIGEHRPEVEDEWETPKLVLDE